jgi:hypothetical protein
MADLPYPFMLLKLSYDGGLIVSAQLIMGKQLSYDGGLIGIF